MLYTDPDALLDQLTLEEQVALLSGADAWRTAAVPRLNIPPLKVSDGPAGVRGGGPLIGGRRTAAYPVGIALGATWNVDLLREVGGRWRVRRATRAPRCCSRRPSTCSARR
ncbi:hypothetical protein ACFQDE_13890 [Deinococcus caeni]|uniref:hypothetical protein n=1 Tax=Deinococcus caeni TaxID=569127 RepID=UPI00360DA80D